MADADLIYFLHIPKTAGTSLYAFQSRAIGPERATELLLWDHLATGAVTIGPDTRLVGGHLAGLLPLWLRRRVRVLTTLRDPIARALSHINHVQRSPQHPLYPAAAGLSVAEYCRRPELRHTVDNVQSRYLASLGLALSLLPIVWPDPWGTVQRNFDDALLGMDAGVGLADAAVRALQAVEVAGVCEAYRPSLALFARAVGWTGPVEEAQLNSAPESQKRADRLTDDERAVLARLNTADIAVYRFACHRLADFSADAGIPLDAETFERLSAHADELARLAAG